MLISLRRPSSWVQESCLLPSVQPAYGCANTLTHTVACLWTQAHTHTDTHSHMLVDTSTHIQTHIHAYLHIKAHSYAHEYVHTLVDTRLHRILFSHTHLLRFTASPDLRVGELRAWLGQCTDAPSGRAGGLSYGEGKLLEAGQPPEQSTEQRPPGSSPQRLPPDCLATSQALAPPGPLRMLPIATLAPRGPNGPSLATPLGDPMAPPSS